MQLQGCIVLTNPEWLDDVLEDMADDACLVVYGDKPHRDRRVVVTHINEVRSMAGILAGEAIKRNLKDMVGIGEGADKIVEQAQQIHYMNAKHSLQGQIYTDNFFANLPYIAKSAGVPNHDFRNVPAILVGSGPSLQHSLDALKEVGDKALILACGSGAMPLVYEGIAPHLVTFIDPWPDVIRNIINAKRLPGLFSYTTNSDVVKEWEGQRCFCRLDETGKPFFPVLPPTQTLRCNTTVTSVAFWLAVEWGCSPIIFAGQDFGWQDRSHMDGVEITAGELDRAHYDEMGEYFKVIIPQMSQYLRERGRSSIEFINCSIGGKDIGIPFKRLAEIEFAQEHSLKLDFPEAQSPGLDKEVRGLLSYAQNELNLLRMFSRKMESEKSFAKLDAKFQYLSHGPLWGFISRVLTNPLFEARSDKSWEEMFICLQWADIGIDDLISKLKEVKNCQ